MGATSHSLIHEISHRRALAVRLDLITSTPHSSAAAPQHPSLILTEATDSVSSPLRSQSSLPNDSFDRNGPLSPSLSIRSDGTIRPADLIQAADDDSTRPPQLPPLPDISSEFDTSKPINLTLLVPPTSSKRSSTSSTSKKRLPSITHPSTSPDLHADGLIRILYVFTLLHPHLPYTQGFSELLAPLYWAFAAQDEYLEEADVFWTFVALMAEVGDVVKGPPTGTGSWDQERVDGGERNVKWALQRFSNRIRWADQILWDELERKSLGPKQPYYSYRWLSTMLAQDLPVSRNICRSWTKVEGERWVE